MGGLLLALEVSTMRNAANEQAKATGELATANRHTAQGQQQERLKTAIEHLGHKSDSVRLGGAYELFHLTQDVPKFNRTVLDILCAHIRSTTNSNEYREQHKSAPSQEIQSLLTLLVVREHELFKGLSVDLQESFLQGVDLSYARLEGADLSNTRLQGARLAEARLHRANLAGAQLQGADLLRTRLQGANLFYARLQGSRLLAARLQGANLEGTRLQGTSLLGAQLQGANFRDTQLQGVTGQVPTEFDFAGRIKASVGKEADLSEATLQGGLYKEDLDALIEGLSDEEARPLRRRLEPHIDKPPSNQLPKHIHANLGTYTEEEANRWIADYEKATSKTSAENGS